ncbi:MAG: class I SAM-dependent methyltransferase [Gammaproteobacteria bacterium]|nr:class I SAM-dependent methyltransferase [Gammaproteobacteria bacterium]NIR98376.1 class I SAM-dependent methyltransferase [Gammaproteobacteria bacterium]NIT64130.1 class I SAM-dependent methyltransferase [Gammaproteobacteria bacterium]NIV21067.1 methyltransferase domain-containing protein [Gammaproteobacteria bacterium]NIY32710.1 methyltransferase domain-containing protein [Gammaproteobacteria bacterium]
MIDHLRQKWNARYADAEGPGEPAAVLAENLHLLPHGGAALDLACGLGANACLLARRGLETSAWDVSDVAIERLTERAEAQGVTVHVQVRDVAACPPEPASFDVIVVARFLERDLANAIMQALRPGGLLFYQTFVRDAVDPGIGPPDPTYRLAVNELLALFRPLQVIVYREEGTVGDTSRGFRNEAMYIGRKASGGSARGARPGHPVFDTRYWLYVPD